MTTTTIRMPPDLKARVVAAARKSGQSAHCFIVEAIAEKAEDAERQSELHELADKRFEAIAAQGKTIPWSEMRSYLEQRVEGKKPRRPAPRKLAR
jgi:predicted transcriptional regulator